MLDRICDEECRGRASSAAPRRLAGVVALALAGCTAPGLSTTESEIRGGSVDDADPAVAALSVLGLYAYCTATLISHHTVLTAGHCSLDGLDVIEADFGTRSDAPAQAIEVDAVKRHPMYTAEGKPYDLALMKLASDPAGIAPVTLNGSPLAPGDMGRMLRHVGFGVTDDATGAGGGVKRTVSYALHRVDGMLIYSGAAGQQTCDGDSGGPALMTTGSGSELVVGVVSDGPDCELSQDGWDDRVDLVKDWIVQTVSAWDAPPSFGEIRGGTGGDGTGGTGSGGSGDQSGGPGHGDSQAGCTAAPGGGSGLWLLGLAAWLSRRRRRCGRAR